MCEWSLHRIYVATNGFCRSFTKEHIDLPHIRIFTWNYSNQLSYFILGHILCILDSGVELVLTCYFSLIEHRFEASD